MTPAAHLAAEVARGGGKLSHGLDVPAVRQPCEFAERGQRSEITQPCSEAGATRMLTVRFPSGRMEVKHVCLNHLLHFQSLVGQAGANQ